MAVDVAAMEELDADNKRLSYQGHVADRDIVQVFSLLLLLVIVICLNFLPLSTFFYLLPFATNTFGLCILELLWLSKSFSDHEALGRVCCGFLLPFHCHASSMESQR